jgi:hypothetical protein
MPRRHALLVPPIATSSATVGSCRSLRSRLWVALLAAVLAIAIGLVLAPPAQAASRGAGFGTWAPVSAFGWHGSMLVGGVHT